MRLKTPLSARRLTEPPTLYDSIRKSVSRRGLRRFTKLRMLLQTPYLSTYFIERLSKIYPNWNVWFENIPSGNPDSQSSYVQQKIGVTSAMTL
jgi:hypothetical protein